MVARMAVLALAALAVLAHVAVAKFGGGKVVITMDTSRRGGQGGARGQQQLGRDALGALGALGAEPQLCDDVVQIAGYLQLEEQDKHYFFWFFESRTKPEDAPTTLWMTGGPGCSSGVALFHENGPCVPVDGGKDTKKNPFSWNERSNLIFIDQPAGTGFSYGKTDHNEEGVSQDMYIFLIEFLEKYPKYGKNDFYIFGESYGGHYVPATAHRVWLNNQNPPAGAPHINLAGIGVGNGLTDPEIQYRYYAQMAYNSTTAPARVSERTYKQMLEATPKCIKLIEKCNLPGFPYEKCLDAYLFCNSALIQVYPSEYNVYDMRIKCAKPPLCYDFGDVEHYLNSPMVQKRLGVTKKWESCNMQVNQAMAGGDWMRNYQTQIPDLLKSGIRVLIYAGDADYVCNWIGNKAWTLALDWDGKEAFNNAGDREWVVDGKPAGFVRNYKNFAFLRVSAAGHMVPLDQPRNALQMFDDVAEGGKPFGGALFA